MQQAFSWEEGSTDDYEALGEGDMFDGSSEQLKKDILEQDKEENQKYVNGRKFKKKYKDDLDIEIQDDPDYDPDALIEDNSGMEAELQID